MKKILPLAFLLSLFAIQVNAQKKPVDKSTRASLPAVVSQHLADSVNVVIDYSKPLVKGRTIGKDLEPMEGKVWRTGANEATIFQTNKDVTINGEKLPAGKYGLFTVFNGKEATLIFNKIWDQWGAFTYKQADDQLRVKTNYEEVSSPSEEMTFTISPQGEVDLLWGNRKVTFEVK
jgi:hypothetical protein